MDNSLKDRILESVDIVEVIGERVALRRKGREYVGLCPFHADHNPSMFVNPQKRIFKCWACGAGGDVIRFVQLSERCGFREALESLGRRVGIEPNAGPRDERAARMREQLLAAMNWARQHFERNFADERRGRLAREYTQQRGLSEETVRQARLGLAVDEWDDLLAEGRRRGLSEALLESAGLVTTSQNGKTYDRFRGRLIFPITDALGRVVAFGGRTLGEDSAKYLNSPETVLFNKSRVLYGLDLARGAIQERRAVVVVEGYMDAVLLRQHGVENVVATLGTALTDAHVKLLRGAADVIYLCFDGDEAGVRAADRAVEVALQHPVEVRVVLLEGGQDPADCVVAEGQEGFERQLKAARDALEFKWTQTLSAFSTAAGADRRQALEVYLRFVAQVGALRRS